MPSLNIRGHAFSLVVLFSVGLANATTNAQQDRRAVDDPLEQYLQRLQLHDLQIAHLKRQLDQTSDPTQQTLDGRRLANLYAEKLVRVSDDPEDYQATVNEVQLLLTRVPSADTDILQVMLGQAEYLRAEELIGKWLENRQDFESRDAAKDILVSVSSRMSNQLSTIREKIDRLNQNINETDDERLLVTLEEELRRTQVVDIRANYYSGWANYYAGIFTPEETQRNQYFAFSESAFREFVGIDESEDLSDFDYTWLNLESSLQARGVAGLAMVLLARGDVDTGEHLFQLLLLDGVSASVRRDAPSLCLQGWLNLDLTEQAESFAESFIRTLGGSATPSNTLFCVSLIQYSQAPPPGISSIGNLEQIGVEGLIRLRQFRMLQELNSKQPLSLDDPSDFYLTWAKGNIAFAQAEQSNDIAGFTTATSLFRQALNLPESSDDPRSAGYCHYQLGWSLFSSNELEEAANTFERASLTLEQLDPETAANALWKRYECLQQLAQDNARFQVLAIEALRSLVLKFPDNDLAKTAEYQLARVERNRMPLEDTVAALESVTPDDDNYTTAQYELCGLVHQQWTEATQSGDNGAAVGYATDLLSRVDRYHNVADSEPATRRMKSLLYVVDVALRSNPTNPALARNYLARAERESSSIDSTQAVLAEYHYQRFQLARIENRSADAQREAEWLADNAPDSVFVLSALVLLAQTNDRELESATGDSRTTLLENGRSIYEKLVRFLGTDQQTLRENRNARVSLYRLGQINRDLNRLDDAIDCFASLLAMDETNEVYLRLLALSKFDDGRAGEAIQHWRVLNAGLERGSDGWLEAKYYVIRCLETIDREEAKVVFQQLRRLYPEGTAGNWDDRFRELGSRLNR